MSRNIDAPLRRALVALLCLSLCPSFLPPQVHAQIGKKVRIEIGKPSVWSMGQAHYLLADMRQKNRSLKTKMPDEAALDPNAVNATSIQLLRTLLDIRGEFDQKVGLENATALREQGFNLQKRDDARRRLAGKQNELDDLQLRIDEIDRKLSRLRKEKELRDAEREDVEEGEKKEPLTPEDRARELRIAELESTLAARTAEKTKLQSEITTLEATASANVGATNLTSAPLPEANAGGQLPGFESIADYIRASIGQTKQPSLSASIALDNYIGMQYEIIAKRLTLLRDELGPDERIVFLELPSNIYTVPDKADDYIVQLRWRAKHFYKSDPERARYTERDSANRQTEWERIEKGLYGLKISELSGVCAADARQEQEELEQQKQRQQQPQPKSSPTPEQSQQKKEGWFCVNTPPGNRVDYVASIRDGVWTTEPELRRTAVRALDVIPRQSALNINETYATANKKNFLGVLKLLSGIGLQVNYQRERQLYEQFLQQEIFASGFGKGREEFGWTFGPQPGSKRVSPGLRTTYAVLAVPRYASAIDIEVEGVAYPRKQTPDYDLRLDEPGKNQLVTRESFVVRIPNEVTEKFWVNTVDYTPVRKGGSVTVKINGSNFSPQTGVLVNSVPLTRSLSLTNNETLDAASVVAPGSGVQGAFELMSSNDIMLTFNMGDANFVGTPTITLVTPERTDSINNLPLDKVNNIGKRGGDAPSLKELSSIEPMFTEALSLREYVKEPNGEMRCEGDTYLKGRLYGAGMLPAAEIEVDGRLIPQANRKAIEEYIAEERSGLIGEYLDRARERWVDTFDEEKRQAAVWAAQAAFDESAALENALKLIEGNCSNNRRPREYVYQYSTGEYRIFARARNKNKFNVRYRHQTAHGFDVATYKYLTGEQPQVRRYIAETDENHSLVDLRINTTIPLNQLTLSLGLGEAEGAPDVKYEGDNNYRAIFLVTDENLGEKKGKQIKAKRDTITVTIEDTQDKGAKQSFDVTLPVQPVITGVAHPSTGKPEGPADDEQVLTISGHDLQQVKRVFFGEQEVTIVGGPNFDSIEVKAPKRDVPDNEKVTVTVRVVTTANKVSAASHYTFIGKIKPKPAATTGNSNSGGSGNSNSGGSGNNSPSLSLQRGTGWERRVRARPRGVARGALYGEG
jgi:hypothetical protein